MWRETDSWFELRFVDGSKGYAHLNQYGEYMAIYREDGTEPGDEGVQYECTNDNAPVPSWYTPSE
jgi:hypothetical protein